MKSDLAQFNKVRSAGFTLVEMLTVTAIVILTSFTLLTNFSRSRLDLDRSISGFAGQIRNLQSRAASGARYLDLPRCGYGIHYDPASRDSGIMFYAGPDASPPTDCNAAFFNRNFGTAEDAFIEWVKMSDPAIIAKERFPDIFFQPPDPKTYLNNSNDQAAPPARILIGFPSADCTNDPSACRAVCVYASGKLETPANLICPTN